MELQTADARHEKTWHQFLSELEKQPRLRLAAYLRSVHVKQRGFEKWLYARGYSVHDAKNRVLRFRKESDTLASMMRAFRALGVQVALEMKGIGKVAL